MAQRAGRGTAYLLIVAVPMMLRDVFVILKGWVLTPGCRFLGLPWCPLFDRAVFALLAPVGCILIGRQWKRRTVAHWHPLWLFGGFVLTYSVLLIVSISLLARVSMAYGVPTRLLTPLYIPLLIAGAFMLDYGLDHERERMLLGSIGSLPMVRTMMPGRKGSVLAAIVMIILFLGVASQIVSNVSVIAKVNRDHRTFGFNGLPMDRFRGAAICQGNPRCGKDIQ